MSHEVCDQINYGCKSKWLTRLDALRGNRGNLPKNLLRVRRVEKLIDDNLESLNETSRDCSIVVPTENRVGQWPSIIVSGNQISYEYGEKIIDTTALIKHELRQAYAMKYLNSVANSDTGNPSLIRRTLLRFHRQGIEWKNDPLSIASDVGGDEFLDRVEEFEQSWRNTEKRLSESGDENWQSETIREMSYGFIEMCGMDVTDVDNWVALFRESPTLHGFYISEIHNGQYRDMYACPLLAVEKMALERVE